MIDTRGLTDGLVETEKQKPIEYYQTRDVREHSHLRKALSPTESLLTNEQFRQLPQ
jgi:hypothetical protein